MKTWVIILIIVTVLLIGGGLYGANAIKKLDIGDPKFEGIDIASLFANTGSTDVNLSITVKNANDFSISVRDLNITLFYAGVPVAYNKDSVNTVIQKKSETKVTMKVTVEFGQVKDIATNFLNNVPLEFTYSISTYLFGWVPVPYSGTFTY